MKDHFIRQYIQLDIYCIQLDINDGGKSVQMTFPSGKEMVDTKIWEEIYGGRDRDIALLDIGCGRCEEAAELLKHGVHLTGIDLDGKTLASLQKLYPDARFITGDAAQWLLMQDETFDVILIRRPDAAQRPRSWQQVFDHLAGALKQGGKVIVTSPGRQEIHMCQRWLEENGADTVMKKLDLAEEGYLMKAENLKKKSRQINGLLKELAWNEEEVQFVCDLRTGRCTAVNSSDDKDTKEEKTDVIQ